MNTRTGVLGLVSAVAVAAGAYLIYKRVSAKLAWDEERRAEESERLIESYQAYSEGDLGPKHNGRRKREPQTSA